MDDTCCTNLYAIYHRPEHVEWPGRPKLSINLLKQKRGCYGLILRDGNDRGLAGLADQLAVVMTAQTPAPDLLTAVQTVPPTSAIIYINNKNLELLIRRTFIDQFTENCITRSFVICTVHQV
jgi:hypothetical protein